jgi:hypothetical protein
MDIDNPTPLSLDTLDFVADDLGVENHAQLDKKVLDVAQGTYHPISLLATIVELSNGKLDPHYKSIVNAALFIKNHPELLTLLDDAWSKKLFSAIRNLSASICLQLYNTDPGVGLLRVHHSSITEAVGVPVELSMHSSFSISCHCSSIPSSRGW